jgi:hypothetical protein
MRRQGMTFVFVLFSALVSALVVSRRAEARQVSVEVRLTPPLERPGLAPSLCPMLALSLGQHWWVGGGYELVQDYDAVLWTSENEGHKPLVMSGLRAGTWYRGGASHDGLTFSLGGLLTFANSAFAVDPSPRGIDSDTSVIDFGADLTFGRVGRSLRFELFATPAWSYGRVTSPAIHRQEHYSAFTYRIGLALALVLGS